MLKRCQKMTLEDISKYEKTKKNVFDFVTG